MAGELGGQLELGLERARGHLVQRNGTAIVAVVTVVAATLSLVVTAVGVVAAAKLEYGDLVLVGIVAAR